MCTSSNLFFFNVRVPLIKNNKEDSGKEQKETKDSYMDGKVCYLSMYMNLQS